MASDAAATVRVRAHAKINLNLRVLGRRPDGYHDLRTVFQALALHDTLTFRRRPGPFVIDSNDVRLPAGSSNLVWRAADLLWRHLCGEGEPRDLMVHVEKRIPMKAGLGGGSADAAAALVGLACMWRPDGTADLAPLARQIGADVAFFFTGGAALGLGRGDDIRPMPDLPPLAVLLVLPPFDVSTADAYRWWDEDSGLVGRVEQVGQVGNERSDPRTVGPSDFRTASVPVPPASPAQTIPHCPWPAPDCEVANDFEAIVSARHPQVREIVASLTAAGARAAAMTGSGSTVFGLFDDDDRASRAARAMADAGHEVMRTRTLARREYAAESAPAWL